MLYIKYFLVSFKYKCALFQLLYSSISGVFLLVFKRSYKSYILGSRYVLGIFLVNHLLSKSLSFVVGDGGGHCSSGSQRVIRSM